VRRIGVSERRLRMGAWAILFGLTAASPFGLQAAGPPAPAPAPKPTDQRSDIELVERLLAARRDYQGTLEQLRSHYLAIGDVEKSRWAEDELRQYHRMNKPAYVLELDVPPPTLHAAQNFPEANELYRRAIIYKDKGWGNDYVDNQRRAEILLQQLLTLYPQSDKIGDAAYQLADLYEGKAYKQSRRAGQYFERSFQWNPNTNNDSRIRAARIYDKVLVERARAIELYREVTLHSTDPKQLQEAQKRLADLAGGAK
jgi:hypothetical protein